MDLYVVAHDFANSDRTDYEDYMYALEVYSDAQPILETLWLVVADDTTDAEIANHLKQFVDRDDDLFVARIGTNEATPEVTAISNHYHLHDCVQDALSWWTHGRLADDAR